MLRSRQRSQQRFVEESLFYRVASMHHVAEAMGLPASSIRQTADRPALAAGTHAFEHGTTRFATFVRASDTGVSKTGHGASHASSLRALHAAAKVAPFLTDPTTSFIDFGTEHYDKILGRPYRHFGTEAPGRERKSKDELVSWYQTRSGLEDAFIWLSLLPEDVRNVEHEYRQMVAAEEEEAKFAFYGKLAFFQQDVAHIPRSSARKRSAYCKMEWAPKPDGDLLRCPPMVSHVGSLAASGRNEAPFTFNNKPDCTFWLPMVQFNPVYRRAVPRLTFMVPKAEVVGPYLTIEFKKADQDMASAVNQLAAAAALILFNRVTLRIRRLNEYPLQREQCSVLSHFEGLKHYGIALAAQYANIYVITPRFEETGKDRDGQHGAFDVASVWQGCRVRLLVSLDLTREEDVLEMRCWVNEVQAWGLATHSADLIVDVKGILRKGEGGDERVSLLPHEMRKLGFEA
ncbi:hypothetical protein B0A54_17998 [Friedmanniomyces endolithicus]|uniref:Uncharacterized protein n=1 Tax=Friedmanniomyces endolithicus TaxID=329885 RepID=A0A4V5N3F1_9PEZI|nr:hypothetical protein B0A54_17998 [Friedmanniomyces endolithicus]